MTLKNNVISFYKILDFKLLCKGEDFNYLNENLENDFVMNYKL